MLLSFVLIQSPRLILLWTMFRSIFLLLLPFSAHSNVMLQFPSLVQLLGDFVTLYSFDTVYSTGSLRGIVTVVLYGSLCTNVTTSVYGSLCTNVTIIVYDSFSLFCYFNVQWFAFLVCYYKSDWLIHFSWYSPFLLLHS